MIEGKKKGGGVNKNARKAGVRNLVVLLTAVFVTDIRQDVKDFTETVDESQNGGHHHGNHDYGKNQTF